MPLDPFENWFDLPQPRGGLRRFPGTARKFDALPKPGPQGAWTLAALLLLLLLPAPAARAQNATRNAANPSELAFQNLSRVAASAAELTAVLTKDAGLLVELKKWVARDATEHGQVLTDAELTDEGIFERLRTDIQFRSVATALVQRYGYLLPKLNPDSDPAKEHELELRLRARRLEQNQDQEITNARLDRQALAPPGARPDRPVSRTAPREPDDLGPADEGPTPPRSPLMQASENPAGPPPARAPTEASAAGPALSRIPANAAAGAEGDFAAPAAARGRLPGVFSESDASPAGGGAGGLLAAYGTGMNPENGKRPPEAAGTPGAPDVPSTFFPDVSPRPSARFQPAPEMVRKQGPYESIPSLFDMYVQAVTRPATPQRFGAEVFENGARDSQSIPMDLPAGPDYVVGPGDGLSVDLWGGLSQRLYRVVDREGRVSLPEVGPLLVSGKSLAAVQENLQQALRTQFRDVSADVSLARLRTVRIYEVGDVARPGAYDVSSLSTPLNALFAAGGPTERGSMRLLNHYRGGQLVETVDLYDLLLNGVKRNLQRLENGDTVQVPPIGPQVTVEGMVRRPAIYELRGEKTLAGVLDLAGGLLPSAALGHVEVQRVVAHRKQTMLSLDLPETETAADTARQLEAFEIQDGDRIRIFPIAPYNLDVVFLEGHVARPGRYSFHPGMRLTDVLASYADLLPEPAAQYAEIIRLNAPDFHPSVESFRLAEALSDPAHAPILQAMDTVRIFSRFDFENPPEVSVGGGVRAPGSYQTSGPLRLSDAVHLAGGLLPDAETSEAQVFRYLPGGAVKIFGVRLGWALAGDPAENIFLQPSDRVLIHRNPDAAEPATVSIQGEVAKPGRYPLAEGMRVSDLIRLGGGFKNSADRETADLTEYLPQDAAAAAGHGANRQVRISATLAHGPADDLPLHNGDTLTIRQLTGWTDLGAAITVRGEVAHPGNYGIRPGERLSSVLARAGGFRSTAYPQGIVFEREDVRQLEQKSRDDLIERIRKESASIQTSLQQTAQEQAALAQQSLLQRNQEIAALQQAPVTGRVVVRVPANLARFSGSPDDIEVRRGDTLFVPKRPEFVVVTGQVYNSNAITYRPGRDAKWYLRQAGGATDQGNVKMAFLIRANGGVVSRGEATMWDGGVLGTVVEPGDTLLVPEKAVGGSSGWKNLIAIAQLAEAAATTAFIATR